MPLSRKRRTIDMAHVRAFSRPVAFWVGFFNVLSCMVIVGGSYYVLSRVNAQLAPVIQTAPQNPHMERLVQWSGMALHYFWTVFTPAVLLFFLLMTLLTWAVLRRVLQRRMESQAAPLPRAAKASRLEAIQKESDQKESEEMTQRVFLHLVAVLQKEGRLLDFFSENLAQYNDDQIGAAVRNIHENCKKALDKYLEPQAVVEQNEGDEISVATDFDPNALKLVGNVTGQPPFKGVVRHRGWRARKIDIPTFSGQRDARIIAPAEIEIS
jgi:hypothetical protein